MREKILAVEYVIQVFHNILFGTVLPIFNHLSFWFVGDIANQKQREQSAVPGKLIMNIGEKCFGGQGSDVIN
jgi:hypothetical protein